MCKTDVNWLRRVTPVLCMALFCLSGCTVTSNRFCDRNYVLESELPRLEALVFKSEGSTIYGQILVPSSQIAGMRPCAIICHGFAGFTRWDDVAHDLCRSGIVVIIPHHRGAWGSEGEYTITGCIRDTENLARWAMGADFSAKYRTDTNAVYLVGHSMGGNSVIHAASKTNGVRGIAMIAPCDIGYMAGKMTRDELKTFLIGEGLHVLHRTSDDAVVGDVENHAATMCFTNVAQSLAGIHVFLATGEYDTVVPVEPLDAFWNILPHDDTIHVRKSYRSTHSLIGCRQELTRDLVDFMHKGAMR